jgi:hypothetical protein
VSLRSISGHQFTFVTLEACLDGQVSPFECPLGVEHSGSFVLPSPWWRILDEHQSSFVGIG